MSDRGLEILRAKKEQATLNYATNYEGYMRLLPSEAAWNHLVALANEALKSRGMLRAKEDVIEILQRDVNELETKLEKYE
ncbi:hypothetical protein [Aureibacillus halotolerans]|uniref:Uncharacterized protein n=1 Tax=Aureibacillus halotolerans TaxID=1508390 RepID=A0A4R6TZX1_9BACI|nr:hypothetical protein [Aureibacillus halotolerans]TDQ39201.1 hypothetical protein EV213_108153 [Aureibacillus halotolerans]